MHSTLHIDSGGLEPEHRKQKRLHSVNFDYDMSTVTTLSSSRCGVLQVVTHPAARAYRRSRPNSSREMARPDADEVHTGSTTRDRVIVRPNRIGDR